jgi:DHA1 family tetracycline resistance protein-like MFS transporter
MRKSALLTLFLIVFIDLVGFGLIMPLLPYFGREFGADGAQIGWLFGSYSLMQFLFAPIWGRLSDRIGRRPVLLASLAGGACSYVLLGFSKSYEAALVARILAGICAANIAVANAYVADVTTKENRSKGMGLIGAAFGLGFIFGPALASFFGDHGHALLSFMAAGVSAASFVLTLLFLPESRPATPATPANAARGGGHPFTGWGQAISLPRISALIFVSFLANFAFSNWETTFALFLNGNPLFGYGITDFGKLLIYVGLLVAVMQGGLLGRMVKAFGEPVLLKAGLIAAGAGLLCMPFCRSLTHLMLCLTALGIGLGLLRPVLFGIASILTSSDRQGLILGVLQGAGSLGRIAGPLLGGWLFDRHASLPFLGAAAALLLALALTPPSKYIREAKAAPEEPLGL